MPNLSVIGSLVVLALWPAGGGDPVRIGLFGLFKPEAVEIRSASTLGVPLQGAGVEGNGKLEPGQTLRVRLNGRKLDVVRIDGHGKVEYLSARRLVVGAAAGDLIEVSIPGKIARVVGGQVSVFPGFARNRPALRVDLSTPEESAVASVVAAEIGPQAAPEALKAVAVLARTFIRSNRNRHRDEGFDLCDTTHCQVFMGESGRSGAGPSTAVGAAVSATAGQYLVFEGHSIEGHYTAVCGGLTATPRIVWGGVSPSGYPYERVACRWCAGSPYFEWERSADASLVLAALRNAGIRVSQTAEIKPERLDPSGLVGQVVVSDGGRRFKMSADGFRRAIGSSLGWSTVLSPTFDVRRRGNEFVFRGRGFGSQVGLCLAGASALASADVGYVEILRLYYPRAEIATRNPEYGS